MLVVCLVFLLVISLTAAVTVRRATSSEAVAANARTHALALQAAEAALLHCERLLIRPVAPDSAPVDAPTTADEPFLWEALQNWDGPGSAARVREVPFAGSSAGGPNRYFKRSPECMAQYRQAGNTATVVITARGFGPEVARADSSRSAPRGAEIWLQSVVELPSASRPGSRAWRQVFLRAQ